MRRMVASAFYIFLVSFSATALDIAGITLPEKLNAGKNVLVLNGAGIRTKFGIKIYIGGLYLQEKDNRAQAIICADEPMAVKLHMVSGLVTSERMTSSTREGFKKSTNGNTAPIQHKIDKFIQTFMEKISKNDVFDFVYIPGEGTKAFKNGKYLSTTEGLDFKKALFGIWLCNNPAHKKLKEGMLGL